MKRIFRREKKRKIFTACLSWRSSLPIYSLANDVDPLGTPEQCIRLIEDSDIPIDAAVQISFDIDFVLFRKNFPSSSTSSTSTSSVYDAELAPHYYTELCPLAVEIVKQNVESAVYDDPTLAAALLRLHFHDCFVLGCDASLLLDDTVAIVSEKNAVPNINSLRGFEVIDRIKYLLEEECPLTVSCADILAIVARDAVVLRGGPSWEVYMGRKDSLKASLAAANQMIPAPNSTLDVLIANFEAHGLNIVDLVALSGSHTIGRSRCVSFKGRLYDVLPYEEPSLSYEKRSHLFRRSLHSTCPLSGRDNALVPLDIKTSRRFDNQYYLNLLQGFGLLQSDEVLISQGLEESVRELVWAYAYDQELFFRDFGSSMIKMGSINVLTGNAGEIRENCRYLNV